MALDHEGRVTWDISQTAPGRGAYICPSRTCLDAALKKKKFNRSFRRIVNVNRISQGVAPFDEWTMENEPERAPIA